MSLLESFNAAERHCVKYKSYFSIYEKHLQKFIGKSPRIVEIGIYYGGSTEMWLNYFGEGTSVYAVDVNPSSLNKVAPLPGVTPVLGDAGSDSFWDAFIAKLPGPVDIVLDDGGHLMHQQIMALKKLFPVMSNGGVFLCEDTHSSYWPDSHGGGTHSGTFMSFAKRLTDVMNQEHYRGDLPYVTEANLDIFKGLQSMSFYNSIVVLEKEELEPFTLLTNNPEPIGTL